MKWTMNYCSSATTKSNTLQELSKTAEIIKKVTEEMATKAGEYYNIDCPMAGSGKIGRNWAETH